MTRRKPQQTEETYVPLDAKRNIIDQVAKKRPKGKFLTENQKIYYDTLLNNQITICSGPAGVGKSYIAMKTAVDLLLDDGNVMIKLSLLDRRLRLRKNWEHYPVT